MENDPNMKKLIDELQVISNLGLFIGAGLSKSADSGQGVEKGLSGKKARQKTKIEMEDILESFFGLLMAS